MKPGKIFLFVISIMLLLFAISYFFPKEGIPLTKKKSLLFFDYNQLFTLHKHQTLSDTILKLIKETEKITNYAKETTNKTKDSVSTKELTNSKILKKKIFPLEFKSQEDRKKLFTFFKKISHRNKLLRILHYADSQIEGDKITAFIRYQLQKKFGGNGAGLIPPVNFVNNFSIKQENSDNWTRYSIMENSKYNFTHKKYSFLASFSRFKSYNDSDTTVQTAWLKFSKSPIAYSNTKYFNNFRLFYGNNKKSVVIQLFGDNQLIDFASLQPIDFGIYHCTLPNNLNEVTIKLIGADSPDIYAVAFDNNYGVAIDNIPIRGSSGTFFTKLDYNHLKKSYSALNIGLIIMEFGGNVLPYIKDSAACEQYGRYYFSQIRRLQKLTSNVPIIVIGVADMCIKEKTEFVSYPLIEKLQTEIKKAAFDAGAGFWDMYKAMGGKNSIAAWVNANPPLAAPDYTHFTSKGANVIANMFYNAIINEYNTYKNTDKK